MNKRYSLKAITIYELKQLIEHFYEKDNRNDFQILLMTPYGFIKGDLENISDEEGFIKNEKGAPNSFKVDLSYLVKMRRDFIDSLENENIEIVDNGATLNFRNVEIFKNDLSQPIMTLEQMLVFADHIISVSLVSRKMQ